MTHIFDHQCNQQDLFEQILEQPTNEVFSGANWLLCTLGLTNSGKTHTMFGTPQEPGLIPKCLHRIFLNVGQNIDNKVFFKPDGLENLIPTTDSTLDTEITARNYIFKDDKNDRVRTNKFSFLLSSFSSSSDECVCRILFNNKIVFKIYPLRVNTKLFFSSSNKIENFD